MIITVKDIENVLALKFDVDITPAAAALILPEVQEFGWQYDREYHRDRQAQARYFRSRDIEEDTYIGVGDRKENAILMFLIPLIGQPCRSAGNRHPSDGARFIASEYFQKNGNVLDVENLSEKNWKTFDEIPQPPKRSGKRKKNIPAEPPSENLLKLNRLLSESKCPETTVEKFQMQLALIADSGINLDEIEIITEDNQTFFSTSKAGKTLSVDLHPSRCAIRLHGNSGIEKIYARKEKDVSEALEWLME